MLELFDTVKTKLNKENLYEQVAQKIEDIIIKNPSMIGEQLPSEQSMAAEFNVSRNVVREAFKALKERGFIDVRNGAGAYVTKPDGNNVKKVLTRIVQTDGSKIVEIFEVRFALEVSAVKIAVERASQKSIKKCENFIELMEQNRKDAFLWAQYDYEFHREIVASMGNSLFLSVFESVCVPLKDIFMKAWGNQKAMNEGISFHQEILAAMIEKNVKKAAKFMEKHLTHSRAEMQKFLAKMNKGLSVNNNNFV
ncbi:MAG: FadR/GntR family transcriptional regulator [Planctomycetia bacterium]|nr:FadR/GntR family transcriptional regulator [Planctomycetia bacterium]